MHRYKRKPLIFFIIVCFVIMQGILGRHQVKQWQNSATLYQNTITTDSSNTFAVMGLANALAAKGLSEKAAVHYFRAFELDFNKVINGQLGSVALTRENLNKLAIETYITAQQKNSSLKKTDYYKGLSYTHLKRYDDAISCFTKELQTYKEQPKTTNALAIVYDRIGDSGNASMYFKKTIQYNPFDLSFENFADVLMRTGNFKEATSYYQLAVKRNPENEEILLKLAEALMVTGKYREAFLSTMDAISIKPDRTKIRSQFVNIFIKQRQTEEAVFRALMEAQRGDLSQSRLEDISQKLENYTKIEEKMFSLLKYIVTLETTRTHPSVLKAKTRNELIEKIINMHLTVLGTNPEHFEITINLAQLYTQLGDRERSIYYYKKALQIDPDNADLHFNLANLLTAEEQNEEAITHYEKALEIQPSFLYALNNLGILLAKNNKAERAIVYFTKALSLDPSFVDGHKSMGVIYYQRGNKDKAILHFQKAVDLAPDNQNIQLMLERVQSM